MGVRWAGGTEGKGEEGSYSTIAGMVTGLFTVATFFVGTIARIVTCLLTFLASDFFHVGRFLLVNTTSQTQNKSAGGKPRRGSWGWGEGGRYRTIPGTVTLCITIAIHELGFLRTICTQSSRNDK